MKAELTYDEYIDGLRESVEEEHYHDHGTDGVAEWVAYNADPANADGWEPHTCESRACECDVEPESAEEEARRTHEENYQIAISVDPWG